MREAANAPRTFADLDGRGEVIEVTCQRCATAVRLSGWHRDRAGRLLHDQPIAGRKYTCTCGGIGLPTIRRRWTEAMTAHGRAREARRLRS
jgi:hypothetical protein